MCSIIGCCGPVADLDAFRAGFQRTLSRGPDDSRMVSAGEGLLGFHRLAIMGLTPEGMQPCRRGNDRLVCNGEIYGFRALKRRLEEQLHSYINHELNRFLNTERPDTVYIPKLPRPKTGGVNKKINYSVSLWQRGYIRRRLEQKCREESVAVIEVFGKSISIQCSQCGMEGTKKDGMFACPHCQAVIEEKTNAARNAKKRGQGDNALCMQKD